METIRKKQEKAEAARRKQVEAERKGEKVELGNKANLLFRL